MPPELFNARFNRLIHRFELFSFLIFRFGRFVGVFARCFLFEQTTGRDPDFVACRNALSGFVKYALGFIGCFEAGEGEPEFDGGGDDFDCAGEEDPRVGCGGFQVDGFFPETDGGGDVFEGCVGVGGLS